MDTRKNMPILTWVKPSLTGRRQSELDAAVKQIGENNVSGIQGDVSNLADLDRLYGAKAGITR
jgi:hypothetical protein